MASPQKQPLTLQQYNKRLQEQRKNSSNTNSYRDKAIARVISASSNNGQVCQKCNNKDTQISNLNKVIQELKSSHESEIRNIRSQASQNKQYSNQSNELESLRRSYDQLKAKFDQNQRVNWSRIKVDGGNPSQISRLQTEALRQENQILANKVDFLEQKLRALQDANRQLTLQISNISSGRFQVNQTVQQQPPPIQQVNQPITTYLVQGPPQPLPISIPITVAPPVGVNVQPVPLAQPVNTTFRYISSPKSVSFQLPPVQVKEMHELKSLPCGCTHLSPLAVLNHRHDSPFQSDYYKDIVQERWRSLQHKIRTLENENGKLRNQMCTVHF